MNNKGRTGVETLAKPLKTNLSLISHEKDYSAKARIHGKNEKTS